MTLFRRHRTVCASRRGVLFCRALTLLFFLASLLAAPAEDTWIAGEAEGNPAWQYLEWLREHHLSEDGKLGSLLQAWEDTQLMPNNNAPAFWEPIGPAPLRNSLGSVTYSGRVNALAVDPRDSNVIYIGAALGGVWKTTDAGLSWMPLTDDQPSMAMGALAIDPANPDIIYAGTGEQNFAIDSLYGLGVLRSTNAGATWTRLGGDVFLNPTGGGTTISRLLIDPKNTATIYAATTYGLFKSTDRGDRWTLKLGSRTVASVTDLLIDPTNPSTLYAALSSPFVRTEKGFYRSTNGGDTWTRINPGLTDAQFGRMNIALAPSDPNILYAAVQNIATPATPAMFRFKSTDGGLTWQRIADCTAGCAQGFFNNVLAVHPKDPDVVYHGAVNLMRSMNGGLNWSNTTRIHPDHHVLVFDADGNLYIGQDGGFFRINLDDSTSNLNTNLNLTQYYPGVVLHPSNPDYILGGTQDNGSTRFTGDAPNWFQTCGGDGMYQAIEGPDGDPDNVWYCSQFNLAIRKTTDNGRTTQAATNGLERSGSGFVAPFIIDPNNSQTLIAGTRYVWRTEDGAAFWERNSPLLIPTGYINALAFAPANSDTTYYAGTSTGRILYTKDAGASWNGASLGIPNRIVTSIRISPLDSSRVYATFSGFGTGHVFRSANGGGNWVDISSNLPNVPVNSILIDILPDHPVLYVGTDIGVFRSLNDGEAWERFSNGLPNTRVEELVHNPDTGVFIAVTHGRGIWRLNPGQ